MTSEWTLELIDVAHTYPEGDWRLEVPRFGIRKGEMVGIVGPNGSGKSTLLKICAGVLTPERGRVLQDGTPLRVLERRAIARRIGYLPQSVTPMFDFVVEDVVRMGRYAHLEGLGGTGARDEAVVAATLQSAELAGLKTRRLSSLSGGEVKRVLLASVLAQEPRVLLLDEPTAALDLEHQVRLHRLLTGLAEQGIGVVSVTHDLNLASLFFDRLVLVQNGRIIDDGAPDAVLTQDAMDRLYGRQVMVHPHPSLPRPMVLPRP